MEWPWISRKRREQELEEELQAHLAMASCDRMESGQERREAQQAALSEFGTRALVQEVTREMWGWSRLERLRQDVRYALRTMRRAPIFTVTVVLSLALGIGANTAVFSLINALMLRQLPVRAPGQLVEVLKVYPGDPRLNAYPAGAYRYIRDHNQVFSGLIATAAKRVSIRRVEDRPAQAADGEWVSGNTSRFWELSPESQAYRP